jgi:hypothetical protein
MRTSIAVLLSALAAVAVSCAPNEEGRPPRPPTRQLPLEVVTADTPESPAPMQASRGKNGTGKEREAQLSAPPPVARPASPPPPARPVPPPRREPGTTPPPRR